jgi:outer membrane lipoprotein-sorting protein
MTTTCFSAVHWRLAPLFLAALLLVSACVPRQPPAPPVPAGMDRLLLQQLAAQRSNFSSLEGLARVRLVSDGRSQNSNQVLFAESPDRFRSEVLSPFGQPLLLITADGRELRVLVPGEGRFFRGEASAENLGRFTGLPLGFETLVPFLLYQVPLVSHDESVVQGGPRGGYRLTLFHQGERRQELEFDRELRLVGVLYLLAEEPLLRLAYGRFTDQALPFPQQINLEVPGESEVTLNFSDLRTNISIPPERFFLPVPPGAEVLPFP